MSSSISALAAITWKDLIEPFFPDLKETDKAIVTKILCNTISFDIIDESVNMKKNHLTYT